MSPVPIPPTPPPTPTPDGSGSGPAPAAGSGRRRLIKFVAPAGTPVGSGHAPSTRDIFVGTLCGTMQPIGSGSGPWPAGQRRMLKRARDSAGRLEWAGSGSGSGANFVSTLVPFVPPPYTPATTFCCPDGYFGTAALYPELLWVFIQRLSGWDQVAPYCIDLDGLALVLHFRGVEVGGFYRWSSNSVFVTLRHPVWFIGPGLVPVFHGWVNETVRLEVQALANCVDAPGTTNDYVDWSLNVTIWPTAGVLGFGVLRRQIPVPEGDPTAVTRCLLPFPAVFGGGNGSDLDHQLVTMQRGLTAVGDYDPCNVTNSVGITDTYQITLQGPYPPLVPGTPPVPPHGPGVGSGSGSGSTHWLTPGPIGNRGLAKYISPVGSGAARRPAVVEACCPSGSGGGFVTVDCETDPVSTTLDATATVVAGSCPGIDGQTIAINYRGFGSWLGTFTVGGVPVTFQFVCSTGAWGFSTTSPGGTCEWDPGDAAGGGGFPVTSTAMADRTSTCCPGSTIQITVTTP